MIVALKNMHLLAALSLSLLLLTPTCVASNHKDHHPRTFSTKSGTNKPSSFVPKSLAKKKSSNALGAATVLSGGATSNQKRTTKKTTAKPKSAKSSAVAAVDPLISWGDVGNALTVILSFVLLARTPFDLGKCEPGPCDVIGYDGQLDPCYVCDGFCISNPGDSRWNSHMLSLYSDLLFTIPLLWLRNNADLESLGLNDFFLSNLKVYSVAGHGLAHWALSALTLAGIQVENNASLQQTVAVLLVLARFGNQGALEQAKNVWNQVRGKQVSVQAMNDLALKNRSGNTIRSIAAPILAGISLALLSDHTAAVNAMADEPTIVNYLVFGITCFVFFEAGIPPAANNWIFSVAFSAITTWIAVGVLGVSSIQQSFTIVFTSAYLVSALYQMFLWDKDTKRKNPYPYAVTAWGSNLLTTLVGWLLALKCTSLRNFGGHVWYDFSISTSYFLLYQLVKKNAEKK